MSVCLPCICLIWLCVNLLQALFTPPLIRVLIRKVGQVLLLWSAHIVLHLTSTYWASKFKLSVGILHFQHLCVDDPNVSNFKCLCWSMKAERRLYLLCINKINFGIWSLNCKLYYLQFIYIYNGHFQQLSFIDRCLS